MSKQQPQQRAVSLYIIYFIFLNLIHVFNVIFYLFTLLFYFITLHIQIYDYSYFRRNFINWDAQATDNCGMQVISLL